MRQKIQPELRAQAAVDPWKPVVAAAALTAAANTVVPELVEDLGIPVTGK